MSSYPGASIFRIDLNNVVAGVDLLSAPAFLSRTPGYWALTTSFILLIKKAETAI